MGTALGDTRPFKKSLREYGQKGQVNAPVMGALAEISPDTNAIADLTAPS